MKYTYKLVPMEPTAEMIEAAEDIYMPSGDMDLAIRAALLAAPAVQGEPSRKEMYKEFSEWCQNNRGFDLDCRLHTHGGPIDHGGYIADEITRVAFAAFRAGRLLAPQPAEQQPVLDVSALVAALEEGLRAIGDHHAPDDCYATGPMTGDPFRDLVQCPACSFIAMCDDILAELNKQTRGGA